MTASENRRWAFAGVVTVALWVVGVLLLTSNQPGDHATGSEILAWYRSDTNRIVFGSWIFMLGCLGFVTFVNGLRRQFGEVVGSTAQLPWLAFGGGVMTGVCGLLFASTDLAGGIDKTDIDPATAATFHHVGDAFFVCAELAVMLPIAAVAIMAWRTRVLPRWWALFSGLLVIVLFVGPIGWAGLIFGLPIWTLGTSLFVLLRSPERLRAAAAAA
jgi:hypothetical protein